MTKRIAWVAAQIALVVVAMAGTASADYRDEVLSDNPIGYWRLTEAGGDALAADETTNNRPLTYNNFTADSELAPGPFVTEAVTAPSFVSAERNTISASDPLDFAFTAGQSFSYDFWLRTSSGASPDQVGVIVKGYTTTQQVLPWYLSRIEVADGATEFFTRDSNSASQQANGTIDVSDGSWHHIAAVYDAAAAENRIYVDGVLDATKTNVPEDNYGTNSEVFTLGTHFDRFFTGQLAEVAIYDSALPEERVQAHFNAAVLVPDLIGDLNFDGAIDMGDFSVLLENINFGFAYAQGDLNRDLKVDLHDFVQFRNIFQTAGAGAVAVAVPEPCSGLSLLLGGVGLAIAARRRRLGRG